ncbi:MAG: serine/threonine-protein kinase [Phycisphaerales bacterium]|nr:serine/threonine-protein kinase [Phycisphaerales bacterium]
MTDDHQPEQVPEDPTQVSPPPEGPPSVPLIDPAGRLRPERRIGTQLGHFTIKRVIGSGGMGTVYEALQEKPRRTVALKVMRAGMATHSARRRFQYEVEVLARLRHPCIAQIFEAGTDIEEGESPWFAMEYLVGARSLTDHASHKSLSMRERLELFARVCDGAHHGHQKGVIHRDLKPGNILVTSHGDPKIIDFGVARSTDSDMAVTTLQTDMGALIGTLQYMSPEQCAADPHDIDVRSDVYALGVVLYELLTDAKPYDVSGQAMLEAARMVRDDPPIKPSTVSRIVRGDIETICLKALEKDRDRRYQSALELQQDIERYLAGDPIAARRPTLSYQLKLMVRRHRVAAILSMALCLLLVISTALLAWLATSQAAALTESRRQASRSQAMIDGITQLITPPISDGVVWTPETTWKAVLDHGRTVCDWQTLGTLQSANHVLHVAYFRLVLASAYMNVGAFEDALDMASGTSAELRKWYPNDDPGLLDASIVEAQALMAVGRYDKAVELANEVLEAKTARLGAGSNDTLGTVWEVVVLLEEAGLVDEAHRIGEEALGSDPAQLIGNSKQAADLMMLLNVLPLEERPRSVQSAYAMLLGRDSLESMEVLLAMAQDELALTPRAGAVLETLDAARGTVMSFGEQSDLVREWRIIRGHALEGDQRYEEAAAVMEAQRERDSGRADLTDRQREIVNASLKRISERLGIQPKP